MSLKKVVVVVVFGYYKMQIYRNILYLTVCTHIVSR